MKPTTTTTTSTSTTTTTNNRNNTTTNTNNSNNTNNNTNTNTATNRRFFSHRFHRRVGRDGLAGAVNSVQEVHGRLYVRDELRGPKHKCGTVVSGWQPPLVSRIGVVDHTWSRQASNAASFASSRSCGGRGGGGGAVCYEWLGGSALATMGRDFAAV